MKLDPVGDDVDLPARLACHAVQKRGEPLGEHGEPQRASVCPLTTLDTVAAETPANWASLAMVITPPLVSGAGGSEVEAMSEVPPEDDQGEVDHW
ncbi:hypothetical protein [Saccharothrix stipae]